MKRNPSSIPAIFLDNLLFRTQCALLLGTEFSYAFCLYLSLRYLLSEYVRVVRGVHNVQERILDHCFQVLIWAKKDGSNL